MALFDRRLDQITRAEIEAATAEFLERGGRIEKLKGGYKPANTWEAKRTFGRRGVI